MIWKLIQKDIRRRIKQPAGYLILVAMPLLFALLIGLVFGPKESGESLIRVKMLIEDRDDSFASHFIANAFGNEELQNMFDVSVADSGAGRPLMDQGRASALLIIPQGFGDSLIHQNNVALTLIKNPSEAFAPKIAEETIQILAEGGDRLVSMAEGPLTTIRRRLDSDTEISEPEIALMGIQLYRMIRKVDNILFPPLITINTSTSDDSEEGSDLSSLYAYILCGVLVMALLFSLEVLSRDFFLEQENHTLTRQRVATGIARFVLAKMGFVYLSGLISFVLVWMIAIPLFGISLSLIQVGRMALFSLVLMAGLNGVITMIYALAKNRNQGQSIAPAVILGFSMLGGAMVPLENFPPFIRQISVVSPVYWGIDALRKITLADASLRDISTHIAILTAVAVLLLIPSIIFQQRKFRS
ncbi:ABC transporter permease [bacterium]|nr:ABC transporter permease [bacterium]